MIETINGIINTVFVIVLAKEFFDCFFVSKQFKISVKTVIYILWFVVCVGIAYFLDGVFILKICLICFVHTIANYVLYEQITLMKRLVFSVLYVSLGIVCDYLMLIILEVIMPEYNYYNFLQSPVGMTVGTFSLLTQFLVIILLKRLFNESGTLILDNKMLIKFLMIPLFSFVFITLSISDYGTLATSRRGEITIVVALLIMFLNLTTYYLLQTVVVSEREKSENKLIIEQGRHFADYYKHILDDREKQQSQLHEYKNTVSTALILARKGEKNKLIEYLGRINQELVRVPLFIETGNALVDAVINSKYSDARRAGVPIHLAIERIEEIDIGDAELVTILSNLLDNAIEACTRNGDVEGGITFKINVDDHYLYIYEKNVGEPINFINGEVVTSKVDKTSHGYGLNNVRRAVESSNGDFNISYSNGLIEVVISIPIKNV